MIINWVIIGIFVVIGLFVLKMEHHSRKIKVLLIAIIGFSLYFSVVGMMSSEKVDITSPRGIINAVYIYFGWIGETTTNLWNIGTDTVSLVGNAIKLNDTDSGGRRG